MGCAASEDWTEDNIVVVPHAWRDDDRWRAIQAETQERIGTTLRELYAELLQQPLSPGLQRLIRQIETRSETCLHEC